ncbi:MAG TPA: hypothetical protein VEA38_23030 [Terriglobales bacterium]|nr:hypothetical protein [Terriglobales bacterium]
MSSGAYYEVHVIVGGEAPRSALAAMCVANGFWASELTSDTGGEERPGDVILTTRDSRQEAAIERIKRLVLDAKYTGIKVRRYKVEHCVLDSKVADELALLGAGGAA